MSMRFATSVLIAFAAMSAHAQTLPASADSRSSAVVTSRDTAVLPVWNNRSGKVEALLLLDPARQNESPGAFGNGASSVFGVGSRYSSGQTTLQAGISTDNSSGLALLCNAQNGLTTLGSLHDKCLLASLDASSQDPRSPFFHPAQTVRAEARFARPKSLFEVSIGKADLQLGGVDWLSPTSGLLPGMSILGGQFSQQDVSARGQLKFGDDGWVSIGGTLAHARLVPTDGSAGSLGQRWNTTSLNVAAGKGKLSGEVIGRVVEVPGQPITSNTFGVGLSWQTPWKGKFTVGAEHSNGRNPLLQPADAKDPSKTDGTVPYVRYHQDL
jgi:hypothetical protein